MLNQVVQEEPTESLDQIRLGFYASIGIQKGKPFAPDQRMKKILTEAAAVGDATARAIAFRTRGKDAYYYENSAWQLPFVGGYQFQMQPGVLNLDGYISYYFLATGVTPAMEQKMVGQGFPRCQGQPARRRKELQAAFAAEYSREGLLVRDSVHQPDAFDASNQSAVSQRRQPDQGPPRQRRRFDRRVLWPEGSGGQGVELGADGPGSRLEHDPAAVRSAGPMVQQDLASWGNRIAAVTRSCQVIRSAGASTDGRLVTVIDSTTHARRRSDETLSG
jgi:hypothetical protein